jgi:hypothetical protein
MYNVQIDDLVRPATAEEIAIFKAKEIEESNKLAEAEAKATAKTALLDKLGITAEEAALLLS